MSIIRRLGPEAPKKKIGLSKKNNLVYVRKKIVNVVVILKLNLIRRSMPSEFE